MSDGTLNLLSRLSSSSDHDYNSGSSTAPCSGLSLKDREIASLSLKRIFEQLNGGTAAVLPPPAPSDQLHNVHHQPSSVHVNLDLQLAAGGGVRNDEEGSLACGSSAAAATLTTASPAPLMKSPYTTPNINKAQLTIFYAGTVNVYDDFAADKAEAITLLAGSGSGNSPTIKNNSMADYNPKPAQSNTKLALSVENSGLNTMSSKISSVPPSPNIINIPDAPLAKRSISHIELPYARTASLTRFLGKRRDRLQAKARVIHPSSKIDEEDKRPAFSLNMDAYNHRYLIDHTETGPIED